MKAQAVAQNHWVAAKLSNKNCRFFVTSSQPATRITPFSKRTNGLNRRLGSDAWYDVAFIVPNDKETSKSLT